MAKGKLPKYTLGYNEQEDQWDLREDKTKKLLTSFDTKGEATAGGALRSALGDEGGSVKIKKVDGKIQEERTFPDSADPKSSKG
jgi:hypothetical protein